MSDTKYIHNIVYSDGMFVIPLLDGEKNICLDHATKHSTDNIDKYTKWNSYANIVGKICFKRLQNALNLKEKIIIKTQWHKLSEKFGISWTFKEEESLEGKKELIALIQVFEDKAILKMIIRKEKVEEYIKRPVNADIYNIKGILHYDDIKKNDNIIVDFLPQETPMSEKKVEIFCYGITDGKPVIGGWGVVLKSTGHEKEISGFVLEQPTTNRMELIAAIEAFSTLKGPCNVLLKTNSQYLQRGLTDWVNYWISNNWKSKKDGSPVFNKDLWESLIKITAQHKVEVRWIKGNFEEPENKRCEELAKEEILKNSEKKEKEMQPPEPQRKIWNEKDREILRTLRDYGTPPELIAQVLSCRIEEI